MNHSTSDHKHHEGLIQQTEKWINKFIIHYDICPFAKNVMSHQKVAFYVTDEVDREECLVDVITKLHLLRKMPEIETALLIYSTAFKDFDTYLDFLDIANQFLEEQEFSDEYQLASFHPDYCFEGEEYSDAANFTNRSPFPMLHLLRQSSVEKGLSFYENPEQIPLINIKRTRELGYDTLNKLRKSCIR